MTPPVAIGLVGVGFGRQVQAPAFRLDPRCEVRAVCATSRARAQTAAAALGVVGACDDWRELVADPAIHALALAVPPAAQAEIALAAAFAGKHLFCEKPLALDTAQAQAILAAAGQRGVAHAMNFIFPEIPAWQQARELLPSLGRIRTVALTWRVETFAYRTGRTGWKTSLAHGGGTLNNFASHTFYYLEWLFGPITRLAARLRPGAATMAETGVDLWLEFAAGFPATVAIAADTYLGPGHGLEVYGDDGALRLENKTADYATGFTLAAATRPATRLETIPTPTGNGEDGRIAPTARIASRWLDAILTGRPVTPGFRQGVRVQMLTDAARTAAASGTWQTMTPP